jgi:hypothetical protein
LAVVWVGVAQLALGFVLLLLTVDTARRAEGVGALSFLTTVAGLGAWTVASGTGHLIRELYELESASLVVELGFHVSRIADSTRQILVPLSYVLFVLVYTTRTDRSERQLLFALVPFGLLHAVGTTCVALVSLATATLPAGLRSTLSAGLLTFFQFAVTISLFVTGG